MRVVPFTVAVIALLGLLFGGSLLLLSGGAEGFNAKFATLTRGFDARVPLELGRTVKLAVPRGFVAKPFTNTYIFTDSQRPFAHDIAPESARFEATLGKHKPRGGEAWSAMLEVEVGTKLTSLPDDWKQIDTGEYRLSAATRTGHAVLSPEGRVRVALSAKLDVYSEQQCTGIARDVLASVRIDETALASLFEQYRAHQANRNRDLDQAHEWLGRYFGALPQEHLIPVSTPAGDVFFFESVPRRKVVLYAFVAPIQGDFAALRLNSGVAREIIRQPDAENGLRILVRQTSGLRAYRVGASEIDFRHLAAENVILARTPPGGASLWRTGTSDDLSNNGARWLEEWFADTARIRAARDTIVKR